MKRKPSPRSTHAVGLLRERLARDELERVEDVARSGGAQGLLAHAVTLRERAHQAETRLDALSAEIERDADAAQRVVDDYLALTENSPAQLRADRRALFKSKGQHPSLAALTERAVLRVFRADLECEVSLAVFRSMLTADDATPVAVDAALDLARAPGRWSRRVEALLVVRAFCRYAMTPDVRARVGSACTSLAAPTEHRWVQPAALDALARLDADAALGIVRGRFQHPGEGDDFLVRERLVELAARMRRGGDWQTVFELAAGDGSEHVRLTAARVDRSVGRLTTLAADDASEKVRAAALVALTKRGGAAAEPSLARAATHDPSALVVRTAAECFTLLARRSLLKSRKHSEGALVIAAARSDLHTRVRAAIVEELAAVDVLTDPLLRVVLDLFARVLPHAPVGGGVRVVAPQLVAVRDEQIGRILSVLATGDFALAADRTTDGFVVYRSERRRLALWRVWTELFHPQPSKRQGYTHSWGRVMRGRVRAPPSGLAELTATNVPGERTLLPNSGDWGRHLPLIDDLLHSGVFARTPTLIVGASGTTRITPPRGLLRRVSAWFALSLGYRRFAEHRMRSLASSEPAVQRGFSDLVRRATGIELDFVAHPFASALPSPPELDRGPPSSAPRGGRLGSVAALLPTAGPFLDGLSRDFLHYAARPEGNRLPHVGAYAAAVLVAMLTRGVLIRRAIDADRKSIPLVLGGWGTRGKSGTERIKAALLQGLGYEVLVKTTGCEAMFIHAIPGLRAQEVFIYRPYDKATVWEQSALLRLGRRFGVRAFLWECMALQPDLVNLLQSQWMRDDYSTITNAYPDHEDVQGPSGYDVAQVISEFVPTNGRLFTAEDQMLPLIRARAEERGTSLRAVGDREAALIGADVLARFPYHEHPKNIALVCALAQAWGVPAAIALAEMADHVVPDLGVLKTYPRVDYRGRSIAFTNGMSANERTGALSNWVRMGFDRFDPSAEPGRRIVTVVNNRGDRVARSEVFARFLVHDIGAHQHVLIGTNVVGLMGFLREALTQHLANIAPSRDLTGGESERRAMARERIAAAMRRLQITDTTMGSVVAELAAFDLPALDPAVLKVALAPATIDESYAQALRAVHALIPAGYSIEARSFVVTTIARRRVVRAIDEALDALLTSDAARLDRIFAAAYRALFEAQLLPLYDAGLTGDQIIDTIARHCPPGARIDVMGVQNIKGTGLDFVYRWVSLDTVERALSKASSLHGEQRGEGLRELMAHGDYGLVDAEHAHRALEALRARAPSGAQATFDPVIAHVAAIAQRRRAALEAKRSRSWADAVRGLFGTTFDYLDSVRRQRMARDVLEDLVAGRVSHAAAAVRMRAIVGRAKGAWAQRGSKTSLTS